MSYLNADALVFGAIALGLMFMIIPRTRSFLENNSGAFGVVFALVAGVYVLKEYQVSEHDDRLDRARHYIERIESGPVHDSRQWIDLHWIKQRDLIAKIGKANQGPTADRDIAKALKREYERDFDETNDQNLQNIQHVMRLFYFYSDLAKCVELNLCDAPTACEVFAEDIGKFYVLHSEFISRWSEVSFEKNFELIKRFMIKTCGVG